MRADRLMLAAGAALAVGLLAAAVWWPGEVLPGWLGAATALAAIPAGALTLAMMMRLIPGAWGEALRLSAEAATLLTPLAALAFVPVLIGLPAIYPWIHDRAALSAFQRLLLAPLPFLIVTLARFAAQHWTALRVRRRRAVVPTAAAGLVVLPLLASLAAVEWLMSLDPHFSSSAFGLQFLLRETMIAFSALLLLRLGAGRPPRRLGVLGALLLVLVLLWGYFAFLPFFISWSSNLPDPVGWYQRRLTGGWYAALWACGLLNGASGAALLFARVREDPLWLRRLAAATLIAALIEIGWTTLTGRGAEAVAAYGLALAVIALFAVPALRIALRRRVAARRPA